MPGETRTDGPGSSLLFVVRNAHGWAGTERVLNLVANGLSGRFAVEVLSLSEAPAPGLGYPYDPRVRLSYLPLPPGGAGILASNLRAARFVARRGYDVVVLAGVGEIKHFLAALFCLGGTKFVAWEHFNAALTYRKPNRWLAARFCDAVVAIAERDAEDWRRLLAPRAKLVSIPNPVPFFPESPSPLSEKRVLALGRLEEQKRFDLLLEAFAAFAEKRPDWRLRIRGSGAGEAGLRSKAEGLGIGDRFELLPPTPDVSAEYGQSSVYAMSSAFEGFPMTLLEALAHGVPCVSFDCPNGPSEIIRDGEDGFVVPQGDRAALADRLGLLADSPQLRRAMGGRGRTNVGRYAIGPILDRWAELIEGLCAL